MIKNIRHPNIEMHLGVTFTTSKDGDLEFFMVTERVSDLKTLDEYLKDLKKPT